MSKARVLAVAALVAILGAGSAAYANPSGTDTTTVQIVGGNFLRVNRSITTTYRFPDRIAVHRGQFIVFQNKTDDVHTVSLVREADLPTTANGVFNCGLCNAVNNVYGLNGAGPPKGVQIDSGKLTDDESDHDADRPDPAVPPSVRPHLPFPVLVQDFNFDSYTSGAQTIIGDSTLIPSVAQHVGFTSRTIQVTVSPGTYHYLCTFHAWMQGELVVLS
jgi:plastocyanin